MGFWDKRESRKAARERDETIDIQRASVGQPKKGPQQKKYERRDENRKRQVTRLEKKNRQTDSERRKAGNPSSRGMWSSSKPSPKAPISKPKRKNGGSTFGPSGGGGMFGRGGGGGRPKGGGSFRGSGSPLGGNKSNNKGKQNGRGGKRLY